MWSLILIAGGFMGGLVSTIPGYPSEAACDAAGLRITMEFNRAYACVDTLTGDVSMRPRSRSVVAPFGVPRYCVNSMGQHYIAPNGPCRPGDEEAE
jgi:hypothetical protein